MLFLVIVHLMKIRIEEIILAIKTMILQMQLDIITATLSRHIHQMSMSSSHILIKGIPLKLTHNKDTHKEVILSKDIISLDHILNNIIIEIV